MLLTSTVRPFSGFVYGLTQPTLLLEIQLSPDLSMQMDLEVFDALMSEWLIAHNFASGLAESGPQAVLERLMKLYLALQSGQKVPVFGSGKILGVSPGDQPGSMRAVLVLPYCHVTASRIALGWSMQTLNTLLFSPSRDLATDQVRQKLQASQQKLLTYAASDTNTIHFLRTAFDMGVTAWRLWSTGYGFGLASRMRRLQSSTTDETKAMAAFITHSKRLTAEMLRRHGIPTPQHQSVKDAQEALAAAAKMGYPVVIKPDDQEQGRGVSAGLTNPSAVEAAFMQACALSKTVLVEKHHEGQDYRLTVFRNQVIKVIQRRPAAVVGDGVHTVTELIELQINSDPRRGEEEDFPLDTIRLDEHTTSVLELKRQGLTADSVPEAGRSVLIMRTGNMALDVTDEVHPDVAAQAVLAARVVGLDIAGVDLVARDISQPLAAQGGAIVEVNAGPGLLMHLKPAVGQPRPVGLAIANHLFNPAETGRVPVVGLMGDGDTTRPAKLVSWLLHLKGLYTGLACADGLFMNQRQLQSQNGMAWENAQRLLINRSVQAAVFESDARHLLAEGLPYDRCQVGVVTRMPKAQGLDDLYAGSDEKMPSYVRTQIDVILPHGTAVLNAADDQVADLARHCDGGVIFYADDENTPRLVAHLAAGGRVAFWRDGQLVLSEGQRESLVLSTKRPAVSRLLQDGRLNTDDMLIAACVAWALDISTDLIRAGVKSFGQNTSH